MEKRLKEIQARKAELLKELDGDLVETRLAEIELEQANLEKEESEIRTKMNLRSRLGATEEKPQGREENQEQVAESRATAIKESGKLEISVTEVRKHLGRQERATTLATDSLAKPTGVGEVIRDSMNGVSSIVDQVYVQDLSGCGAFEEPYVKTESEATERTDGVANAESSPTFRVAKIMPMLINVTSYVSKNISRLTPIAYEEKVRTLAIKALRRKVANLIMNGKAGEFFGIKIAKNTKDETIFDTLTVATNVIGPTSLRDIIFAYGGNEELGPNGRLFLAKEDLAAFGAVRGTNEKKALYDITPDTSNANTGTIQEGGTIVPYTINGGLTPLSKAVKGAAPIQTMIYGDPQNFELGLFGPYTVEVSRDYKFAEGLLTIIGEVMAGGNVVVDKGFVVVTLAAN